MVNARSLLSHRLRDDARMQLTGALVAALALLAAMRQANAAAPAASPCYQIDVALQEVNSPGVFSAGSTTVLANPRVMVGANDEANVHIGGAASVGNARVPHGIVLRVNVKPAVGNLVRVEGMLEISTANAPSIEFALVRSTRVHFSKLMPCGQTIRTTLNPDAEPKQILELRVDPAQPSAQVAAQAVGSPAAK